MGQTEHTPGAWEWWATDGGGGGYSVVSPHARDGAGEMVWVAESIEGQADAMLIAAAPDLLAACQGLVDQYPADFKPISNAEHLLHIALLDARAAIARARGQKGVVRMGDRYAWYQGKVWIFDGEHCHPNRGQEVHLVDIIDTSRGTSAPAGDVRRITDPETIAAINYFRERRVS